MAKQHGHPGEQYGQPGEQHGPPGEQHGLPGEQHVEEYSSVHLLSDRSVPISWITKSEDWSTVNT